MSKNHNIKTDKKGLILVLAVMALVIFSIMSISLATLGFQGRVKVIRASQQLAARQAADAGHDAAVYTLNNWIAGGPTPPTVINESFSDSGQSFSSFLKSEPGLAYEITSVGTYNGLTHMVQSSTSLESPFQYAIHVKDSIELKAKAYLDGYDSTSGSYGGINSDLPTQLGTNDDDPGDVSLKNGVEISEGSKVVVGPDATDPDSVVDDKADWGGEIYPSAEELIFSDVVAPSGLTAIPSIDIPEANSITLTEGSYKVDSVLINPFGKLNIKGAVVIYIENDSLLKNSAEIRIIEQSTPTTPPTPPSPSPSSLKLYIGGSFEAMNGAEVINETHDSTKLYFYGLPTCDSIILKNSSDFYGAIYAPDALLDIRNSGDIYGSFVGNDMILHNSVDFHYDYALRDPDFGDPGVKFVPKKWREN